MGHSKADKAQSRERIVAAAAVRIREAGLGSISVGEIMKSVNLTHGGFYGQGESESEDAEQFAVTA
jgi:TetR/AcrR family transcriptional regulator, transcriptional repressor for nem operon